MEIAYKFTPKEIKKLSKFKNPRIVLKKDNIIKNCRYEIHLTKNMFNRLLEKGELKYVLQIKGKNIICKMVVIWEIFLKLFYHMQ